MYDAVLLMDALIFFGSTIFQFNEQDDVAQLPLIMPYLIHAAKICLGGQRYDYMTATNCKLVTPINYLLKFDRLPNITHIETFTKNDYKTKS